MKKINLSYLLGLCLLLSFTSCELIDNQVPQNSILADQVFKTPIGARAALTGAYDALQSANYYGTRSVLLPDLAGGNLTWTGTFVDFNQVGIRSILTDNASVTGMWNIIYNGINRANQIIDKVPAITDPSFTDKNQVIAEAYFLRAFHYFNLVRSWGGVPLKLTPTDAADISALKIPRNTVAEVYQQIIADLDLALPNLPTSQTNRGRATKAAVYALKARVYLYQKNWQAAIDQAVLASSGFALAANFSDLFVTRGTNEVIWQILYDNADQNGTAFFLLPTANGGRNEVRPSAGLAAAFNANDTRRILSSSVDSKVKFYRPSTGDDYTIIFRLGEMILTRAEALIERNTGTDLTDAVTLINQIRNRAAIGDYAGAVDQTSLRDEVFLQRRLELALEGHYFFDLVRTERASTTLTSPTWNNNQALFPIPLREIQANEKLTQNPGY